MIDIIIKVASIECGIVQSFMVNMSSEMSISRIRVEKCYQHLYEQMMVPHPFTIIVNNDDKIQARFEVYFNKYPIVYSANYWYILENCTCRIINHVIYSELVDNLVSSSKNGAICRKCGFFDQYATPDSDGKGLCYKHFRD